MVMAPSCQNVMADSLYLNLWFADFGLDNMFAHALAVIRVFS
jgi:hypothetical protein